MAPNLLPQFAAHIRSASAPLASSELGLNHPLLLDETRVSGKHVQMVYAPFDHVNASARLVIVGMTPGLFQAQQALAAAARALKDGRSIERSGAIAKVHASFSGEPMRSNLIAMLDRIGVAHLLRADSTASLWGANSGLIHFTSALRYPVFVDGKNWSGSPDMVRTPKLREWLLQYTGAELATLREAVIVPLGPKVAEALQFLADRGLVDRDRVLAGMPHPSGANAERIAYFLGRKARENLSAKTNPDALDRGRAALSRQVAQLMVQKIDENRQ